MAWIRSQNKQILVPIITSIVYSMEYNIPCLVTNIKRGDSFQTMDLLGKFANPEAALEELDRIERWIANGAQGVYQVGKE